MARSALRIGRLDQTGKWQPASLQTLFVGHRKYGHLQQRGQARLLSATGQAIYLGRHQTHRRRPMRPESWWLDPLLRIGMSETLYTIAPTRLLGRPPLSKQEQAVYQQFAKRVRQSPPGW